MLYSVSWFIKKLGDRWSRGRYGNKLTVLCFHRVKNLYEIKSDSDLELSLFQKQLSWLKHNFNVLPLPEAVALAEKGELPNRAISITVDDGYLDSYTHIFPELKAQHLCASFFITTSGLQQGHLWDEKVVEAILQLPKKIRKINFNTRVYEVTDSITRKKTIREIQEAIKYNTLTERDALLDNLWEETGKPIIPHQFMNQQQIKEMFQSGMHIGAHTVNHPILAVESDSTALNEMVNSKKALEAIIKEPVEYFAYPNGKRNKDYLDKHISMVKQAGFKVALSTDWGCIECLNEERFSLKRFTPWDTSELKFCLRLTSNY